MDKTFKPSSFSSHALAGGRTASGSQGVHGAITTALATAGISPRITYMLTIPLALEQGHNRSRCVAE